MAMHWGLGDQPNGYMAKNTGAFLIPALSLGIFLLFMAVPLIDPLRKNYDSFINEYYTLAALVAAFLLYIDLLVISFNLGSGIEILRFMAPGFGALFFYMGLAIRKARQNWFFGVRTPWTLSSAVVWDKTNHIAGNLFMAAGIFALIGIVFPAIGFII